ncbi:potassium-transporting ATPase subunit KdpC [Crenobacter sp. SG2303]|uniref:Potassium-transporting ATPase KdpC subunit n=1 Tax=Crenobacter oryzisoli TaxID=3056844 RepID=A0ABT7XND0_9NEIS|nr:potassium-transporting ATPase subunit KdpC [Crenobacter sp. SG2303]MDN0075306.1 potassium-transporting ATPase subunit KdpC [Crenobacter sp. SG2303]
MNTMLNSAVRLTLATWLLFGLAYPLAVTGIAQLAFPRQANGSLIAGPGGAPLGAAQVGQNWVGAGWFHGRPSATTDTDPKDPSKTIPAPYNAASSNGSNLGPTSQALHDRLFTDRKALLKDLPGIQTLPADMLTSSASGLDPDISPANALMQAPRVAAARALPLEQVQALIATHTVGRTFGVFGEPRINVLSLNMALQSWQAAKPQQTK